MNDTDLRSMFDLIEVAKQARAATRARVVQAYECTTCSKLFHSREGAENCHNMLGGLSTPWPPRKRTLHAVAATQADSPRRGRHASLGSGDDAWRCQSAVRDPLRRVEPRAHKLTETAWLRGILSICSGGGSGRRAGLKTLHPPSAPVAWNPVGTQQSARFGPFRRCAPLRHVGVRWARTNLAVRTLSENRAGPKKDSRMNEPSYPARLTPCGNPPVMQIEVGLTASPHPWCPRCGMLMEGLVWLSERFDEVCRPYRDPSGSRPCPPGRHLHRWCPTCKRDWWEPCAAGGAPHIFWSHPVPGSTSTE